MPAMDQLYRESFIVLNNYLRNTVRGFLLLMFFLVAAIGSISCDDMDIYTYADKYSHYGPVWNPSMTGNVVSLYFPEDAVNVTETSNYSTSTINAGDVYITTVTYDPELRKADLTLTFTGTDGSGFYIEIVESALPITMGSMVLEGFKSPQYPTDDLYQPQVETILPTITDSYIGTHTVYIIFSEPMNAASVETITNYGTQYGGAISLSIISVIYNASSCTAELRVQVTAGDINDQYRVYVNNLVTDMAGNQLNTTTYSPWYTIL